MDNQEAIAIMRALASGVTPQTGEKMDAASICRQPEVIKALNRGLGALVQLEQREQRRPPHAGRYWSRDEDAQVCAEVRRGIDFTEIAKSHNRSVPSIVARLIKLGEIRPGAARSEAHETPRLSLESGLRSR